MRQNSVLIDTTHGLIHFPNLTMQVKIALNEMSFQPQAVFINDSITVPPMTAKTIIALVYHLLDWKTTGIVNPVQKFTKAASLIISHSISTNIEGNIAVKVNGIFLYHQ